MRKYLSYSVPFALSWSGCSLCIFGIPDPEFLIYNNGLNARPVHQKV